MITKPLRVGALALMTIGYQVLRQFRVTFDSANRRIRLEQ